jgi:predicted transcriptional regulator
MAVNARKNLVLANRRQRVAELYLKGLSQGAIAEELGVKQSTVSRDLKRIQEDWRQSTIRDFDLAREEQLKKLTMVEQEGWSGYERSQKPQQEARVKEGDQSKATKTMKSRVGDPRFLDVILKCSAARRALLDLDRAKPFVEITNSGIQTTDLSELRRTMLANPEYVEFCRQRALGENASASSEDNQPEAPAADVGDSQSETAGDGNPPSQE